MAAWDFKDILVHIIKQGASDLHLTVGNPPMMRVKGKIQPINNDGNSIEKEELHQLLNDILTEEQRKQLEREKELDLSLEIEDIGRFRVNVFFTRRGEGAVLRYIPDELKSFSELGLPEYFLKPLCMAKKGLALVTGPTGSGKSTTLASMIDYINAHRNDHIITIEDPIEFIHRHKKSIVSQREVGTHTKSFQRALRSALREDPDVILVGELRDLETISLALTAAETGHLVFGTLHTINASKTVDRIIDVFPSGQQQQIRFMFSEACIAVISQVLLNRRDGKGRTPAFEMMLAITAIKSLIRESKTYQIPTVIQTSHKYGMKTLDQSLKNLVMCGIVDSREAFPYVTNPSLFKDGLSKSVYPSEKTSLFHHYDDFEMGEDYI